METSPEYLERLWSDLLSRQPDLILLAYDALDSDSQEAVYAHLNRMVIEPGWLPEQRESAIAALIVIGNRSSQEK